MASWSARKGILTLRNPSNVAQSIAIDVERVFELPPSAARSYSAKGPWDHYSGTQTIQFRAGEERRISLEPLEVLTLEMAHL